MIRHSSPAPARPLMRFAGAFVLAVLLPLSACDRTTEGATTSDEKGPRVLELNADTVHLPDSVHVATVRIDRTKLAELEPPDVAVRTGDLVRFIASDAGAHAIAFDGGAMPDAGRTFLDNSGQMRSPPLVSSGSTWVVSFKDAPPGRYPFRCPTHGAQGVITVSAR